MGRKHAAAFYFGSPSSMTAIPALAVADAALPSLSPLGWPSSEPYLERYWYCNME